LVAVMDAGISEDVTHRTTHPWNVTEAGEVAGPGRRRPLRRALALAVALTLAIGLLIAIVAFIVPLTSAAGGCGGG
jgi:hypothetical protein